MMKKQAQSFKRKGESILFLCFLMLTTSIFAKCVTEMLLPMPYNKAYGRTQKTLSPILIVLRMGGYRTSITRPW